MKQDTNNLKQVHEMITLIRREQARGKKNYWIQCGSVLLGDDEVIKQKWINFVESSVNGHECGMLIDETLQIMTMIKNNIPSEVIRNVLEQIPEKDIVITYLSAFIHPELLFNIEKGMKK